MIWIGIQSDIMDFWKMFLDWKGKVIECILGLISKLCTGLILSSTAGFCDDDLIIDFHMNVIVRKRQDIITWDEMRWHPVIPVFSSVSFRSSRILLSTSRSALPFHYKFQTPMLCYENILKKKMAQFYFYWFGWPLEFSCTFLDPQMSCYYNSNA